MTVTEDQTPIPEEDEPIEEPVIDPVPDEPASAPSDPAED